ncbi:MAG TPA: YbaK/EbsC family protein [Acidobacteriota bacterium]|nr:YbaK/EbsC family protein [Acidobacteriota bacterium]
MPGNKVKQFLDEHHVSYQAIPHTRAFTAQGVAASAHIPGRELAKTVMIKVDGEMAMAVLPANYRINFDLLASSIGADRVELANEVEFRQLFPDCEVGAMPPFGNLYGMEVYVTESLAEDEQIAFNAGSHTELIQIPYQDFERLVKPKVLKFSTRNLVPS